MLFSKSFKFVEAEKGSTDPFQSAKTRLVENLQTQLKCAEAMVKGEAYMPLSCRTIDAPFSLQLSEKETRYGEQWNYLGGSNFQFSS